MRLSSNFVLIALKKQDKFSTLVLNDKLGKVTGSTLSHELKTLLNAIIVNLELFEDDMSNRFVLKSLLNKFGYSSIEAQNGLDAVEIVERHIKNNTIRTLLIIFMDSQTPVMNGIKSTETILNILSIAGISPPPIIGISSDSLEEDRYKSEKAGITEFINKPLDKQKVKAILDRYIIKKSSLSF